MDKDVRKWLAYLGFEHLVGTFEENAIDWALLPDINNDDLKDLGVTRLADRKMLLVAISKLKDSEPEVVPELQPLASNFASESMPVEAEFRLLTVMFFTRLNMDWCRTQSTRTC